MCNSSKFSFCIKFDVDFLSFLFYSYFVMYHIDTRKKITEVFYMEKTCVRLEIGGTWVFLECRSEERLDNPLGLSLWAPDMEVN